MKRVKAIKHTKPQKHTCIQTQNTLADASRHTHMAYKHTYTQAHMHTNTKHASRHTHMAHKHTYTQAHMHTNTKHASRHNTNSCTQTDSHAHMHIRLRTHKLVLPCLDQQREALIARLAETRKLIIRSARNHQHAVLRRHLHVNDVSDRDGLAGFDRQQRRVETEVVTRHVQPAVQRDGFHKRARQFCQQTLRIGKFECFAEQLHALAARRANHGGRGETRTRGGCACGAGVSGFRIAARAARRDAADTVFARSGFYSWPNLHTNIK